MGLELANCYYRWRGQAMRASKLGAAYVYGMAEQWAGQLPSSCDAEAKLALYARFEAEAARTTKADERAAWAEVLRVAQPHLA